MKAVFAVVWTWIASLLLPVSGHAVGDPTDTATAHWGGFPTPVTSVGWAVTDAYNFIFWITAVIFILVQIVLLYCIVRYRRKANPKPARFSHHVPLEIVWTVIPVIICAAIAWKSFEAMYHMRTMPEQGLDVEVIAYQFGWEFDYPDAEISAALPVEPHPQLSSAGVERLVKDLVVPVDTNVRLHVTARDVIHAFYVPHLGIKIDTIPGRINYAWFRATQEGDYIGQCAELCGSAHGEMFFNVKVVSKEAYHAWVNARRNENGLEPLDAVQLAALAE